MVKNNTAVSLYDPVGELTDSLTEVACEGARRILAIALETEVNDFLTQHAALKTNKVNNALYAMVF